MSIELKNVVSGYRRKQEILHGVSLSAEKSKVTGIIGPNGAGKSTLLKTIYGIVRPRKGVVLFNGQNITGEDPHTLLKKGIAFIPQQRSVFIHLTVQENIKLGMWTFRKNKKRVEDSFDEINDTFPILRERKEVLAGKLSGGEQRMLELGRALVARPKAILLDEPTAGLAPKVAEEIYRNLEKLKELEITILFVDQNVRKAITLSDQIYVIKSGRVELGGVKEEFDKKKSALIRDWLI